MQAVVFLLLITLCMPKFGGRHILYHVHAPHLQPAQSTKRKGEPVLLTAPCRREHGWRHPQVKQREATFWHTAEAEAVRESCSLFLRQMGYRDYSRYLSFHFPFTHERPLLQHLRACPWRLNQGAFKVYLQPVMPTCHTSLSCQPVMPACHASLSCLLGRQYVLMDFPYIRCLCYCVYFSMISGKLADSRLSS